MINPSVSFTHIKAEPGFKSVTYWFHLVSFWPPFLVSFGGKSKETNNRDCGGSFLVRQTQVFDPGVAL